jgi:membrane protease YdiL (CAAX protease family)
MTEGTWTVRQAVLGFAWMMLASSLLSGLVLFALDAVDGEVPLDDPGVLLGLVVATAMGFILGIAYGVRVAGLEAFTWTPITRNDTAFAVCAVVPAIGIGFLWSRLFTFLGGDPETQVFVAGLLDTPDQAVFLVSVFYAVLGGPILEEVFFRGFMQPPLIRRFGAVGGIVITSMIFGLIHAVDPWAIIPVVAIGVIAGWLRHRSGGLGAPIVFHGLNNGVALLLNAGLG